MKRLTESNMLFLKAVCLDMGIKGEIDEYGNVYNIETQEESAIEKKIFGIRFVTKQAKTIKNKIPVITLQEVMSKKLGIEYDPNDLVMNLLSGMLSDKE